MNANTTPMTIDAATWRALSGPYGRVPLGPTWRRPFGNAGFKQAAAQAPGRHTQNPFSVCRS